MPWLYFDLMVHGSARSQGSMILEDEAGARDRATRLPGNFASPDRSWKEKVALCV